MDRPNLDYAGLFDASPNPYLVLDRALNIAGANRAYLAATKRTLDDIVGRWAWDAFPTDPETLRQAIASFERVLRTGEADTMALLRFDIPRPEAEGGGFEERYWSIVHAPVLDAAGEVALVLQHPIDVTELKRLRDAAQCARGTGQQLELAPAQSGIFERAQTVYETNLSLRAEGDHLRGLFEQAPGFMCVLRGPEHRFELANAAYLRLVGDRDLVGKPVREALPELERQGFFELLDRVYATGEPFVGRGVQIALQADPGAAPETRFVDFVYQPITDEVGRVCGIFVEGSDVTEAKRAADALRAERDRGRGILESMAEGFLLFDRDFRITEINAEGLRIDGRPREALVGCHLLEAWPEAAHMPTWPAYRRAMAERVPVAVEYRHVSGAHDVWLEVRAYPVADGGGLAVFYRDITDRKQAAAALHASEARLARLLATTPAGVVELDAEGRFAYANTAAERMLGAGPGGLVGRRYDDPAWQLATTDDDEGAPVPPERLPAAWALRGEPVLDYGHAITALDGRRVALLVDAVPVRDEAGQVEGALATFQDVTARHAQARALRASEERLRLVVEGARDYAILTTDPERRVTSWSAGAAAVFGYTAAEIMGRPTDLLFTPEDREAGAPEHEAELARRDGVAPNVRWHQRRDGARVFLNGSVRPLRDDAGRELGLLKVARDETEARRAEERRSALLELSDRFRDLDDPADLAYAAAEILGRTLGVSRAGYGTVDLAAETISIERDWNAPGIAGLAGVLHFRDYGSYIEDLKRGETVVFADAETDPRTAATADTLKAISAQAAIAVPITEQGGFVALLYLNHATARPWPADELAFVRDVAERTRTAVERRRAEQELHALAASLERQVEERTAERDRVWRNSRDLLVVVGADGVFRAVNPAWTAILGHSPAEVVGRSFLDFVWPDDAAVTRAALESAAAARDLTSFENRYRHKGGSPRWISWHTTTEGDLVYAYGRDVTAQKTQEEALRQAEAALRQAQKMEAVGQLTGGIAHDFNNMLQAIGGSLELMQRRVVQGRAAEANRYAEGAQETVVRAAAMTHRLLAFARRQALQPEPVEPDELVEGMAELIRRTVGPGVQVELRLNDGVWSVLCDPNQLESALLNLAINARDAMPEGGRLTIRTEDVTLSAADVAGQDGADPGEYVEIAVADTGTGMDEATRARAFEPFFTTKPIGQGTGLGLSQLYGFVRQSGGFVRLDSAPGRGTTVRLYLPRHADTGKEAAPTEQGRAEAPRAGAGEAVLLVEDEADVRAVAAEQLRELGYVVLEAGDGPAALRLLRTSARVDLLVTDVGLPGGMNGRQVADVAREHRRGLPVLFITGYAGGALEEHLAPGMAVIGKPFALDTLAARVRTMLETVPAK